MTRIGPVSTRIWDMKYRLKQADGTPIDQTVDDTFARVALAAAQAEKPQDRKLWTDRFHAAMDDFKFLPAGRILAGAGVDRRVTLFNCFVMGTIPDDMSGIFENLREAALTMQAGGGIGYDFSTLRPHGALVRGVGADASGPLTFMDVWDTMCRAIMSAGSRRGAMMATMRADHPDIEAFIEAKGDAKRLRMFNLSVLATDPFMAAVKADHPWDLCFGGKVYKTVRARDLWDKIMQATYDYAEPGVIFIDRINQRNNLYYCESIAATNPCGEQPLPPYGACLLGSINLAALVEHPFSPHAAINTARLEELVGVAVRLMDNVIDVSRFPLDAQAGEARAKRRIGLGLTGLGDALIYCNLIYGSDEAAKQAKDWMAAIERAAYVASVELAREKGAFPLFDAEPYLAGQTIQGLDGALRAAIKTHGIRNGLLTSIAPTGTISLFADNVSSGIEPVFAFDVTRKVLMPDGTRKEERVLDPALKRWEEMFPERAPGPAFVTAQTLTPADHVAMQAAVQQHVDSSISKTINMPADISFDDFAAVYLDAYDRGCKGCTTYRPNGITGSVMQPTLQPAPVDHAGPTSDPAAHATMGEVVHLTQPLARPTTLPGQTYKLRWPESDHALYITINDVIEASGRRRPFEIFVNSKNMEHYAWTLALTRMISAVFRRGGDVSFVVEELKAVFDPRGGQWMDGRYVPSLLAAIGGVIEEHLRAIGFMTGDQSPMHGNNLAAGRLVVVSDQPSSGLKACPRCGERSLDRAEGCETCQSCAYSRCG
jgi:ribonucleoside-diphosphate reductase alpha chain